MNRRRVPAVATARRRPKPAGAPAEASSVADRVLSAAIGTLDILVITLGERLGYYRLLAQRGPLTPPALATASGTASRYAREWPPFTLAVGPAGHYLHALPAEQQAAVRDACRPHIPDSPFTLTARAWYACGQVPR
jgi:hypothetical protein